MTDSSSSFFSSSLFDGLSFILEESCDDREMLKYVLDDETDMRKIELLMKLRQAIRVTRASSSPRRHHHED